ncbi:hypothetical protein CLV49_3335 [Labedella gwakjiensis]|uniref:PKD domain-containing protein n=1 Tax=Labedella gwakjiensis TaxID=390269 RepID=A0A2P8H0H2_9MICO|nr:hypothetical protein [Labedella gwakjiensis]PSL39690.1 hypothetical protein CLV49_3335 [Labedella gwakjiensis]RUQ85924.1 hypothetical protein ELQ93_02580 [Labedella gwakjiensis]
MALAHVLLVTHLLAAATLPGNIALTAACVEASAVSGLCIDAGASGGSADLTGTQNTENGGPSPSSPGGSGVSPNPDTSSPGTGVDPTQITDTLGTCRSDRCGDTGTRSITLTDLASFTPTTPAIHMEPDGWALRGRPANAIAETTTNTHDGTLLGHAVTVRFTPTAYRWDWGDGSQNVFSTPGATWENLGVPRFSETDTSHTYSDRGTVEVSLAVDYSVAFRFGDGEWITVEGTVSSANTVDVYVGTAKTVNVPDDCDADPTAPGC